MDHEWMNRTVAGADDFHQAVVLFYGVPGEARFRTPVDISLFLIRVYNEFFKENISFTFETDNFLRKKFKEEFEFILLNEHLGHDRFQTLNFDDVANSLHVCSVNFV